MSNAIKELKDIAFDKKLLIVEDEIELNNELVELFELFFKTVDFAYDGEKGYEKIINNSYDVIISDIDMPVLNGLEMIIKVLDNNGTKENFIILSGRLSENKKLIQELDIKYSCNKPYDLDFLLSQIINILNGAPD